MVIVCVNCMLNVTVVTDYNENACKINNLTYLAAFYCPRKFELAAHDLTLVKLG